MLTKKFIVAEISKNWDGENPENDILLCQLFEQAIETNEDRGYELHSFSLHRVVTRPDELNETIIAVFKRKEKSK